MRVNMQVREEREVEVCDRCKERPASVTISVNFAPLGIELKPEGLHAGVYCQPCREIIENSFTRTPRPRKAAENKTVTTA